MARIAVFSLTYPPFVGGAEVAIAEIAARCRTHQFTVFTARLKAGLSEREQIGAVTVVRVGRGTRWDKFRYPWMASRAAVREHQQAPFQLNWGMMASWGGFAALKFNDACPAVPYVLTEQSGDSDAFIAARTWFWQSRYRQIYAKADAVTALSKFLADRAKRYGAKDVTIIPNAVNVAAFSRSIGEHERKTWRERLGIADTRTVVLTISRLVSKNGVDDAIAAIALLLRRGVAVTLAIAGSGPMELKLRAQCRALGCDEQVKFLGHVEQADLPALLSLSDVFVRPSRSEGFGIAFVEAMAAGVPVVATRVGGIPDFIRDGETGVFCRPRDAASVAEAIAKIIKDRGLHDRLVQNGRLMVSEQYDWEKIAPQMERIFQLVLKASLPPRQGKVVAPTSKV